MTRCSIARMPETPTNDSVALARGIRVLEGIGLIAAIATAVIGFFQWQTAKSTSEHTALTTRPWVRVNGIIYKDGIVTVAYRNDGHSPAQIMPTLFAQFFQRKLSPSDAEKQLKFPDELSTQWPTGIATKVVGADTGNVDAKLVPRASIGPREIWIRPVRKLTKIHRR